MSRVPLAVAQACLAQSSGQATRLLLSPRRRPPRINGGNEDGAV